MGVLLVGMPIIFTSLKCRWSYIVVVCVYTVAWWARWVLLPNTNRHIHMHQGVVTQGREKRMKESNGVGVLTKCCTPPPITVYVEWRNDRPSLASCLGLPLPVLLSKYPYKYSTLAKPMLI